MQTKGTHALLLLIARFHRPAIPYAPSEWRPGEGKISVLAICGRMTGRNFSPSTVCVRMLAWQRYKHKPQQRFFEPVDGRIDAMLLQKKLLLLLLSSLPGLSHAARSQDPEMMMTPRIFSPPPFLSPSKMHLQSGAGVPPSAIVKPKFSLSSPNLKTAKSFSLRSSSAE